MKSNAVVIAALSVATALAAPASDGGSPMNLLDADQKPAAEKSLRDLRAAPSLREAAGSNQAVVTLVRNQNSVAKVRGFSVVQDEPASVAGGATGPTPTDYFMVALGTCQNVVFGRFAALEEIGIESLETTVTGIWDRRGLYGIAGIDAAFQEISIETNIGTTAPAAKVAEIARRTKDGCPIFATLRKETRLSIRVIANGQPVSF